MPCSGATTSVTRAPRRLRLEGGKAALRRRLATLAAGCCALGPRSYYLYCPSALGLAPFASDARGTRGPLRTDVASRVRLHGCAELREPGARLVPRGIGRGVVEPRHEGPAHQLTAFRDRREVAVRHELDEHVADRGGLGRPRQHRTPRRLRRPRAERRVPRAAADEVQLLELAAGHARERVDGLRVLQREALEQAGKRRPLVGRLLLA